MRGDVLHRGIRDAHVVDPLDLAGDGLADEDDPRRLGAVQVAVVTQRSGQEGVAVAVDLEDGADDAADGLHLVPHRDVRTLRLACGLRLALLGSDEEEVAEDPDRHEGEQGQEGARRRFRSGGQQAGERRGWCHGEILGPKWLRRATLVPGFPLSRALRAPSEVPSRPCGGATGKQPKTAPAATAVLQSTPHQ